MLVKYLLCKHDHCKQVSIRVTRCALGPANHGPNAAAAPTTPGRASGPAPRPAPGRAGGGRVRARAGGAGGRAVLRPGPSTPVDGRAARSLAGAGGRGRGVPRAPLGVAAAALSCRTRDPRGRAANPWQGIESSSEGHTVPSLETPVF